jgi:hypothetical protein
MKEENYKILLPGISSFCMQLHKTIKYSIFVLFKNYQHYFGYCNLHLITKTHSAKYGFNDLHDFQPIVDKGSISLKHELKALRHKCI